MLKQLKAFINSRHRVIPHEDEEKDGAKMEQWRVFGNGQSWAALFVQRFLDEEDKRFFHCHRHELMMSIPLGPFKEERRLPTGETYFKWHLPFVPYVMNASTVHRIVWWPRFTFSLWLQLANKTEWGFIMRETGMYFRFDDRIPLGKRVDWV